MLSSLDPRGGAALARRRLRPLILLGLAAIVAACSGDPTYPPPDDSEFIPIAGDWSLATVEGESVPAAYWSERDVVLEDGTRVGLVEILLDHAATSFAGDGRYTRQYTFSEWHDGVMRFRHSWGDHGIYTLQRDAASYRLLLLMTSEYIQNLSTTGEVFEGELRMTETLWHGEDPRATIWRR